MATVWVLGLLGPGPQDYLVFSPLSEVQQGPGLLHGHCLESSGV